ncbi:MAG: hypothetical protein AAFV33_05005 [Chloroflexota bacterium]
MRLLNLTEMTVLSYHDLHAETAPSTGFEVISPAGKPVFPGDLMPAGEYPAQSSGKTFYVTHLEYDSWLVHLYIISLTYTPPDKYEQVAIQDGARRFYWRVWNEWKYVYNIDSIMLGD